MCHSSRWCGWHSLVGLGLQTLQSSLCSQAHGLVSECLFPLHPLMKTPLTLHLGPTLFQDDLFSTLPYFQVQSHP
jgi:hypothetical protein